MENRKKSVILNSNCKGGKGLEYWTKVYPSLEKLYGPFDVHVSCDKRKSQNIIKKLIEQGERTFVSAGGDGCMNLLINSIIAHKKQTPLSEFTIGAVGLGSSNDYHKPFTEKVQNIPVRLNDDNPVLRDVGEIVYSNGSSEHKRTYFLISSSTGIVAEGNENFNRGGAILSFLKKTSTDLAIIWAFFQTLRKFENVPFEVKLDDEDVFNFYTSYLAVSKTQYISGMFHFDEDIQRDDGKFMLKILHDYTKMDLIKSLFSLSMGNERGLHDIFSRSVKALEVSSVVPFTLECDGETLTARRVKFQIYEERIRECT